MRKKQSSLYHSTLGQKKALEVKTIGRAIKLTSDETQGTLLENGLRGEQILKSRGVSIKCYLQVSPKCSESRSDLPRVTGGDSVLTSS